jgi:ferrous iron transport protein B
VKTTIALAGNPNVGKTTLFNALTGLNQRTGNYPGVTVSWHAGAWALPGGEAELLDLPGSYSIAAHSPDEAVVQRLLAGEDGPRPAALLAIVDASNPERNLYFLSQLMDLGLPTVVALNMVDVARERGLEVDAAKLGRALGCRVVPVQANQRKGLDELAAAMQAAVAEAQPARGPGLPTLLPGAAEPDTIRRRYAWARQMLVDAVTRSSPGGPRLSDKVDKVLTHKVWGLLAMVLVMGAIFQSIFAWSQPIMDAIDAGVHFAGAWALRPVPPGLLKELLADGVVAGVGSVLVFVPQIAVLFFFIAILEDCGYMARSAFLMDRLFSKLGLSGRSFIPLLSSFACAVPGILGTRTIADRKERLTAMLVAPLMSCSARLPIYTVMIACFVPGRMMIGGLIDQRALVLFALYALGLVVAIPVAFLIKRGMHAGAAPLFLIELPGYKWPDWRTVGRRVLEQCREFLGSAGTIILAVAIVVWALGAFPRQPEVQARYAAQRAALEAALAPADAAQAQARQAQLRALDDQEHSERLNRSYLAAAGRAVEPLFRPLGWDWRISMAALASFPAREVVIGTLGTIFNAGGAEDAEGGRLRDALTSVKAEDGRPLFNLAVALGLMVFFALCAQCASTLAVISRESGSWKWAAFTFGYMTVLAWAGAAAVYHLALWLGLA